MGHIYRNLKEIPIPTDAKLNHWDMKVSLYRVQDGKRRRMIIGAATSETTMIPNDNFRSKFPELWRQYYGADTAALHKVHVGLYALCLSIGWKKGLYPDLQETFGPQYANAAMDFAMYSIREKSCTAQLFQDEMREQMLFSRAPYSDAWYSDFFTQELTGERIHRFKTAWLKRCAENGTKSVWLCIDGSNNDCAVSNSTLVATGHAKSHREANIVSYIWAVDAETGRPVTWFVNNGAMHDAKAVDEVIHFLAQSDMNVKGVILDRGFVSQEVFDLLEKKSMSYIVMLKANTYGFCEMMNRHATAIRWRVENFVSPGLFGITDEAEVFRTSKKKNCIGLYFVGMENASRAVKLMDKVISAASEVRAQLAKDPAQVDIASGMKKYLSLVVNKDNQPIDVQVNFENWQMDLDEAGYHAILSSDPRGATEIHELYKLRDVSEKQFCQLKSQLNGAVTRVHSDAAIEARFAVAFVAAVLRTEMQIVCNSLKFDTNEMIRKLDNAYLLRMPNGSYEEIHNHSNRCRQFFDKFDLSMSSFEKFAEEINEQTSRPIYSQVRRLPEAGKKRGPGRPKGSKNKSTIERENRETQSATAENEKPKRGRGRPKGSKNKATIKRENAQGSIAPGVKRKPGRPKGSKNKSTIEREMQAAGTEELKKQGPGRPKGSKNRPGQQASKPKETDSLTSGKESENPTRAKNIQETE